MSKKCIELIDKSLRFKAEFTKNHMSSHLPMALIALSKMGATDEQLERFYTRYAKRLPSKGPIIQKYTSANWKQNLGQHRFNHAYADYFLNEIQQKGISATLKEYLPELMPGISGGAFHPMIRLAYALELNHDAEVAEALGAWAIAYQVFPPSHPVADEYRFMADDLVELLETLAKDDDFKNFKTTRKNIFGKIAEVMNTSSFNFYKNTLDLSNPQASLDEISKTMAELFDDCHDFTILHGFTSTQALRSLQPYLTKPQQRDALQHFTQALAAAYVTVGCPPYQKPAAAPVATHSWSEIFNKACEFNDDHKIKLVYTCYKEHQEQPNQKIYKTIATKFTFPPPKK